MIKLDKTIECQGKMRVGLWSNVWRNTTQYIDFVVFDKTPNLSALPGKYIPYRIKQSIQYKMGIK